MNAVDSNNFADEVTNVKGLVIVDFWGPWCGPCRKQTPILSEVETKNPNVKIVKANVDEDAKLAADQGVDTIPTLLFFKDGNKVATMVGLQSATDIQRKIDAI